MRSDKVHRGSAVPELLTEDEFWTRYFFRVYQVEREEARRKAIIQGKPHVSVVHEAMFIQIAGTNDNDEDFSWEDEEEDPTSPTSKSAPKEVMTAEPPTATESPVHLSASAAETKSRVSTPGNMSPRRSSEDSYDVVSSQVSNSGAAEAAIDAATAKVPSAEKSEEGGDQAESEDSDWE